MTSWETILSFIPPSKYNLTTKRNQTHILYISEYIALNFVLQQWLPQYVLSLETEFSSTPSQALDSFGAS